MARRALVLGASGLIGSRCVEHLLGHGEYERVTCLVRRPAFDIGGGLPGRPAIVLLGATEKLRERVVDFETLRDVDRCDDFYCAIGTTMKKAGSREAFRSIDFGLPKRVAELAVNAGATRIALVSSVGALARSANFYLATKGALEDALSTLPLRALHIMRPSILIGERAERRPAEALSASLGHHARGLFFGPLRKFRPISADHVARAMVAVMVAPDPSPTRQVHEYDAIEKWSATVSAKT